MGRKENNSAFKLSLQINNLTFIDYCNRLKRVATSIFDIENLPNSMNLRFLEETLFYDGQATILKDKNLGIINTRCSPSRSFNIYGIPTGFQCYSYSYNEERELYTGLEENKELKINMNDEELKTCILVMNNWDRIPTATAIELFAYRLYEVERTIDVNLKSQKFPCIITVDEKERMFMLNLYQQYNGNQPFIFGDKSKLNPKSIQVLNTNAPYRIDQLTEYKRSIWNECLTYLRN